MGHQRLWSFGWASAFDLSREQALACIAFIQLVGFGEALVPSDSVLKLQWQDVILTEDGLRLSFELPDVIGPLPICFGSTERMVFERLAVADLADPFADLDLRLVDRVISWIFGLNIGVRELTWANHVVHLFTHDFQQVAYLQGRASAKISGRQNRFAAPAMHLAMDNPVCPLLKDLRRSLGRLNLADLDRRLDEVLPDWRSWSTTGSQSLTPALMIAALRICCSSAIRGRGRRSRSAHTLRWVLEILCQLQLVIDGCPVAAIERADLDRLGVGKKKEHLIGPSLHWLRLACRRAGIPEPKALRFPLRQHVQSIELPDLDELVKAEELFEGDHRLLVKIILLACTVARKAEVGALRVKDVRVLPARLSVGVRQAKGGHSVWRHARMPARLKQLIPQLSSYLVGRDPESRLIAPLAHRSDSTDAIFRRISYRLSKAGLHWTPHLMRTIRATAAAEAGIDHAEISARLAHVRVDTAASSYIVLDPKALRASADKLAESYPVKPSTAAIAWLFGVSERQAQRIHAKISVAFNARTA